MISLERRRSKRLLRVGESEFCWPEFHEPYGCPDLIDLEVNPAESDR